MKTIITYKAYSVSGKKEYQTALFMAFEKQSSDYLWQAARCAMKAAHGHRNVTSFTAIKSN